MSSTIILQLLRLRLGASQTSAMYCTCLFVPVSSRCTICIFYDFPSTSLFPISNSLWTMLQASLCLALHVQLKRILATQLKTVYRLHLPHNCALPAVKQITLTSLQLRLAQHQTTMLQATSKERKDSDQQECQTNSLLRFTKSCL